MHKLTPAMSSIGALLPKKLRKGDFQILNKPTLFEPDWKQLDSIRCPYCCNRLKLTYNRKMYICRGAKHAKKPFAMNAKKLSPTLKPRPIE